MASRSEIILYPTDTLYGLGVNVLDQEALKTLYELKGREEGKVASWLVRDLADIERFAICAGPARKVAEAFLPGPLTLILPAREEVAVRVTAPNHTIGFRISPDPVADQVVREFFAEHDAPLTCTSANVSGAPTFSTPGEILQQFGPKAIAITRVVDDGPRKGLATTVARVSKTGEVEVLREGPISAEAIKSVI